MLSQGCRYHSILGAFSLGIGFEFRPVFFKWGGVGKYQHIVYILIGPVLQ